MSKLTKTYLFDVTSQRYVLKVQRGGFIEPYLAFHFIDENSVPEEASVKYVKLVQKYSSEGKSGDLEDLQQKFESFSLDAAGMNPEMDCSES